MEFDLPSGLRNAGPADWRLIGDITGEAFETDPVNLWIFGHTTALKPTFALLAQAIYLKYGICHLAGEGGATMWIESQNRQELGLIPTLRLLPILMFKGSQGSIFRALKAGKVMDQNHPKDPHLYLFTIGTRKDARGTGLGKLMMAPMKAAADKARLPLYLENSNPMNTGFYQSHGFERMKLFEIGPGAPPMEAMWREPRDPQHV
ncbi:acetyltransferase [Hyphomonas adhaerens MHS-3]|uniref:Acetyltransferase n=1 Tax=Hyphomonas adhaerens MHS-3 TaxID=1280949 RepID=A0A069E1G0_9PROT|nr:GNAT family N-acetyltransferase [Hyphomonas adhaerens]KCZ83546.1 acetyltransferase [Hyphomonas adhaerens MHS-3]